MHICHFYLERRWLVACNQYKRYVFDMIYTHVLFGKAATLLYVSTFFTSFCFVVGIKLGYQLQLHNFYLYWKLFLGIYLRPGSLSILLLCIMLFIFCTGSTVTFRLSMHSFKCASQLSTQKFFKTLGFNFILFQTKMYVQAVAN